ncbi:YD repeat-containing protein [Parageobacillus caldoxylosilyticus]|nr:YD repeat-containing protein [Parageobacillus caldoxylosilyticus]
MVRSYIYGENGQLLAMKKGNETYFYHYNAHGDVIALTDEQGNIVARYQYDAWGEHSFPIRRFGGRKPIPICGIPI